MRMIINILTIAILVIGFITFEVWVILSAIMPELKVVKARNRAERKRLLIIANNLKKVNDKILARKWIGDEEGIAIKDAEEAIRAIAE